jgi:hypothetical protein
MSGIIIKQLIFSKIIIKDGNKTYLRFTIYQVLKSFALKPIRKHQSNGKTHTNLFIFFLKKKKERETDLFFPKIDQAIMNNFSLRMAPFCNMNILEIGNRIVLYLRLLRVVVAFVCRRPSNLHRHMNVIAQHTTCVRVCLCFADLCNRFVSDFRLITDRHPILGLDFRGDPLPV